MGKYLSRAKEYEKEIRRLHEHGVGTGYAQARRYLNELEDLMKHASRAKNKNDERDTPFIHGIVKLMQQMVDQMKEKETNSGST